MRKLWNKLTGIDRLRARIAYLEKNNSITHETAYRMSDLAYDRRLALRAIAACETPTANGTVRRMAKIARDTLAVKADMMEGRIGGGGVGAGEPNTDHNVSAKPKWAGAKI